MIKKKFDTQRERKKVAKLLIDNPKAPDIKRGKNLVFLYMYHLHLSLIDMNPFYSNKNSNFWIL